MEVWGYELKDRLCLCTAGGAFTSASDTLIKSTISANGTAVQRLTTPVPGVTVYNADSLYTHIAGKEPGIVSRQSSSQE